MKKLFCFFLLILSLLGSAGIAIGQELEIHFIDVGWGDCTLIISPSGQKLLMDSGAQEAGTAVRSYLNNLNIDYIEHFVNSHYHADHLGAVPYLFSSGIEFEQVWDRGWEYCTSPYNQYEAAVQEYREMINDGEVIDLGGGVTATCLALNGNGQLDEPFIDASCENGGQNSENDFSVCLRIDYNNFQLFVGGDLSGINSGYYTDIETSVGPECGPVEVYQVNHHGQPTSSNQNFLDWLCPFVSVISLEGSPNEQVVRRLLNNGSDVYYTSLHEDIVVNTDGVDSFYVTATGVNAAYGMNPGCNVVDTITCAQAQHDPGQYDTDIVVANCIVTLDQGVTNPYITDAYIEDSSGYGLNVFSVNVWDELQYGNVVNVYGKIDQNCGTTQIVDLDSIVVVDSNQYVWERALSIADASTIRYEGNRAVVSGVIDSIITEYGFKLMYINDGTGTIPLYISDFSGIDVSGFTPGDMTHAYGVCDVYTCGEDTTYQINIARQIDISNSPVAINMIPWYTPLLVPNSGGQFRFTGLLFNKTDQQVMGDVWTMVEYAGDMYGPLQLFENVPLTPYQLISIPGIYQQVPPGVPPGEYKYWALVGDYPALALDVREFPFRAVPVQQLGTPEVPRIDLWASSGWNFDSYDIVYSESSGDGESINRVVEVKTENYPNPFNPATSITYFLPEPDRVTIDVYNIFGQKVEELIDNYHGAGEHSITWDGSAYSSGVYFYSLKYRDDVKVRKMILVK
ncbi:MAG: T9SS type A sorting domain-containing protein [candidate division Zixibacteria bacterium]|nr:T9SS type A sorting domain-containing protein [candidate division Zixibacteria bacterium]